MSRLARTSTSLLAASADPTTPTLRTGDLYFNTATGRVRTYTGSVWTDYVDVASTQTISGGKTWTTQQNFSDTIAVAISESGTASAGTQSYHSQTFALMTSRWTGAAAAQDPIYIQARRPNAAAAGDRLLRVSSAVEILNSSSTPATTPGMLVDGSNATNAFIVAQTGAGNGGYVIQTSSAGVTVGGAVAPTGITGATSASRYVGATASGAPATGTFVTGDWAIAQNGHLWVCTAGGSPGTWVDAGGSGAVTSVAGRSGAVTLTAADIGAGTFPAGTMTVQGAFQVRTTGGYTTTQLGDATHSGYLEFYSTAASARQGYIGYATTTATQDAGTIPYVAATHAFTGAISTTGTITENGNRVYSAGNAPPYPVTSVATRTGAVTLTAPDIGAGNFGGGTYDFTGIVGLTGSLRMHGSADSGHTIGYDGTLDGIRMAGWKGVELGAYNGGYAALLTATALSGLVTTKSMSGVSYGASGLTGATTASRYAGGTASGAPTTGTFIAGDFIVAVNGHLWICTVGGTPGTWVDAGTYGGGSSAASFASVTKFSPIGA